MVRYRKTGRLSFIRNPYLRVPWHLVRLYHRTLGLFWIWKLSFALFLRVGLTDGASTQVGNIHDATRLQAHTHSDLMARWPDGQMLFQRMVQLSSRSARVACCVDVRMEVS